MKCLIKVVFISSFYQRGHNSEVFCLSLISAGCDIAHYKAYRDPDIEQNDQIVAHWVKGLLQNLIPVCNKNIKIWILNVWQQCLKLVLAYFWFLLTWLWFVKSQILLIILGMRGVTILVPNKHDTLVVFGNKVLLRKIKVMFV